MMGKRADYSAGVKKCPRCCRHLPLMKFGVRTRDGLPRGTCRECNSKQYRHYRDERFATREEWLRYASDSKLKAMYGITIDDYDSLLAGQGGKCAICRGPSGKRRFHVDHNHATGEVRGLLCHHCNMALGLFRDDPELMERAITYLMEIQ